MITQPVNFDAKTFIVSNVFEARLLAWNVTPTSYNFKTLSGDIVVDSGDLDYTNRVAPSTVYALLDDWETAVRGKETFF